MVDRRWLGYGPRVAPVDTLRYEQATGIRTVRRVATSERAVALTFDDGPAASLTQQKLEGLARFGARASFFVVGTEVHRYPDACRAMVGAGHEVGNHSFRHRNLTRLGHAGALSDLQRTQTLIEQVTGTRLPLMRPPYGAYNDTVLRAAAAAGYQVNAMWSVDPRDWARPGVSAVIRRVMAGVAPGAVILLHDWPRETVAALPEILRSLADQGYRAVTLSELLQLPPPAPTRCRPLQVVRPMLRGSDVRAVQDALAARGFAPGSVDGIYGPLTSAAARRYQAAAGLDATGVVDDATYEALGIRCPPEA